MKEKTKKRKLLFDQTGLAAFAERLKLLRAERHITQEQLSYKSGLTLSTIARIETVHINPTLSTVFAIARALEIDLKELFDFPI